MPSPGWKQRKTQAAREFILRNPTASLAKTARETEVSIGTVSRIRKQLRDAGVIGNYPNTPQSPPRRPLSVPGLVTAIDILDGATTPNPKDVAETEAILAGTAPLTREERRKKLEALMHVGSPDHVIRANNELEKMDRRDAAAEEIGPLPPQTIDDGIAEVADMVEALAAWGGEEAVRKAVNRGMERHLEELGRESHVQTATPDLTGSNGG